jgi:hypothetical protein
MTTDEDLALRRAFAKHPRPRLDASFPDELMRRLRHDERERERQHGVGKRLVLGAYWVAAASASAWILRQGPLPDWAAAGLWLAALALVPAGYAVVLWSTMGALAHRERG